MFFYVPAPECFETHDDIVMGKMADFNQINQVVSDNKNILQNIYARKTTPIHSII